jgi:protein-disulfide isomerase
MSKLASPVTAKDHVQGPATASVTLVEYGDYQCPSCGDAAPIVKKLQKHFGDKLRFVFRNFPLEMHPYAEHAAETAEFAAAHDKFWEMHDLLYKHQANLSDPELLKLAIHLGLKANDLSSTLDSGEFAARVKADLKSGEASGLRGTPTFYINGAQHEDSYDYETLVAAIDAAK